MAGQPPSGFGATVGLVAGADIAEGPDIIACDVTKDDQVQAVVADIAGRHGSIEGVVNAAGAGWRSDFLSATDELWSRTLEVNLMGTVRMCRAAIPHMRRSQHPAARHRQLHLAGGEDRRHRDRRTLLGGEGGRALPDEDPCRRVQSGRHPRQRGGAGHHRHGVPRRRARHAGSWAERFRSAASAKPAEVASVVGFLMSADASYLTGEIIDVNGGLYMD